MTRPARSAARERVLGWATVTAPSLLLISPVVAAAGGIDTDRRGAVLVYAMVAFALVIVALAVRIGTAYPRVGATLLLIGLAGVVGGAGFGIDNTTHAGGPGDPPVSAGHGNSGAELPAMLPPAALLPIAVVGIGVALFLAEPTFRWRAAVIVLAGASFPVSRVIDVAELAVLTHFVFVVALVPLGWSMLRVAGDDGGAPGRSTAGSA
jgi:hypothetical protein